MKRRLLSLLHWLGLLLPAYRTYEALRAVRGRGGSADDGLPLPPARLRLMVAGVTGAEWLSRADERQHSPIRDAEPEGAKGNRAWDLALCGSVERCRAVLPWLRARGHPGPPPAIDPTPEGRACL